MGEVVVAGAVIVRAFRLFVARRTRPQSAAGFWELPGAEVRPGEDDRMALDRVFTTEFSISVHCVDQILGERLLQSWQTESGDYSPAVLRLWRCQLPSQSTLDLDRGDPLPNHAEYDESRWADVDDPDAVGPWRDADRLSAGEIADHYHADLVWQQAD
ncbi:NUDIX domain-containing protein [Actinokineospora sp. NBRC 105648]|uniref:NUDIX domain-containing protein n=1 Tax=Actinokineospora sp. NBRC 105648 TaxID=3032206 RepID=UPI0024A30E1F|nr:NUDIX domain-containing protein [Actinokineospora sp. NBRC 105648]GLZ39475.1 DNA mismatch repair protein MutT [Actinokineospora sp. NBRC 105648]